MRAQVVTRENDVGRLLTGAHALYDQRKVTSPQAAQAGRCGMVIATE
jgi:hypothetical protein